MERKDKSVNVKTKDGKIILTLYLRPGDGIVLESAGEAKAGRKTGEKGKGGDFQGDGSGMTYPQKRLLFRLMADQDLEGDAAHDRLKELFQVETLKDVSKVEASRMIERLLNEAKGGAHDGPPF